MSMKETKEKVVIYLKAYLHQCEMEIMLMECDQPNLTMDSLTKLDPQYLRLQGEAAKTRKALYEMTGIKKYAGEK